MSISSDLLFVMSVQSKINTLPLNRLNFTHTSQIDGC